MTKKELNNIVESIVSAVLLRTTEGQPDDYEPTTAEQDEARTLVGIALKRNRKAIIAAVPVFGSVGEAAPAVADAPVSA